MGGCRDEPHSTRSLQGLAAPPWRKGCKKKKVHWLIFTTSSSRDMSCTNMIRLPGSAAGAVLFCPGMTRDALAKCLGLRSSYRPISAYDGCSYTCLFPRPARDQASIYILLLPRLHQLGWSISSLHYIDQSLSSARSMDWTRWDTALEALTPNASIICYSAAPKTPRPVRYQERKPEPSLSTPKIKSSSPTRRLRRRPRKCCTTRSCAKKTKGQQYRVLTRVTFPPHHYVIQALLEPAVDYWLTKVAKRGIAASLSR